MDTFILNIGVGNGRGGGERKEAAYSPGGLHIRSPPAIPIQRTAAGNTAELVKRPSSSVGGENKAVSTAVSKIYFDLSERGQGIRRRVTQLPSRSMQEMRWRD